MQNGNWYGSGEAARLLQISQRGLNKNRLAGKYITRRVKGNGGDQYEFYLQLSDLSGQKQHTTAAQAIQEHPGVVVTAPAPDKTEGEIETEIFADAPEWARKHAQKYVTLLSKCEGLKGNSLKKFIANWNGSHRDQKTSYRTIIDIRKKYEKGGITALLPKYGKTVGKTTVDNRLFEYFKALYMKESDSSARSCWKYTIGEAVRLGIDVDEVPSHASFLRRLKNEVPEQVLYRARYGEAAWNRKYGSYIKRDYQDVRCGQAWVSDHAQIDVCVVDENGKPCFPWFTAWTDFKSGLFLGWNIHSESPNSDHIFMSFYDATLNYGIPEEVILDNGKDYRCRDFAGGRKRIKVTVDETGSTAMLSLLGIKVHFAIPYNAQTKPIERKFLSNKELFSKHMVGYRGGNVTERPEILKDEIKAGKIMHIDEFRKIFDKYIIDCINKDRSKGINLAGLSPYQLWNKENPVIRKVGRDALKLFCMRTAEPVVVGKNGVCDSKLGVTYWSEWMSGIKGRKVYVRRDIKNYTEAWVFDAANDEFLGKAGTDGLSAPALVKNEVGKRQLEDAMSFKRREKKIVNQYLKTLIQTNPDELISNLAAGIQALGGGDIDQAEQKLIQLANTEMDKVIAKEKEMRREGTTDLPVISRPEKKKLIFFESDKQ